MFCRKKKFPGRGIIEKIKLCSKGTVTLPAALRRKYKLKPGDVLTLADLGDGCLVVYARLSRVASITNEIRKIKKKKDLSVTDLYQTLDQEREEYYRRNYGGQVKPNS